MELDKTSEKPLKYHKTEKGCKKVGWFFFSCLPRKSNNAFLKKKYLVARSNQYTIKLLTEQR